MFFFALTETLCSVYVELADQYKDMDPVSDVPKRNMLAQHLREVVDILEQKVSEATKQIELIALTVYVQLAG